jgi:uncharacterized protein DUF1573
LVTDHVPSKRALRRVACGLCAVTFLSANYVLATGGVGPSFSPANAALKGGATEQEQVLRKRVEELYGLMQAGRWKEVEPYVTEDSLEAFRNQKRNPLLGFRVGSIKLDADGQAATVEVQLQVIPPPSPAPVTIPQTTRWRLVGGVWQVILAKPVAEPFNLGGKTGPPHEELKFKSHRYELGKIPEGQAKIARFPFTNVSTHPVQITDVLTGCDCLQVRLEKKEYNPGESGELAVKFDSADHQFLYEQTIVVKTDPGDLKSRLTISAFVDPSPTPKASAPDRQSSWSPHPDAHGQGH